MLQDTQNEKKFNFKLSDALRRAKAGGGGVFDKQVFYVTPKVPVDIKLLKAVVVAGGGQVSVSLSVCHDLQFTTYSRFRSQHRHRGYSKQTLIATLCLARRTSHYGDPLHRAALQCTRRNFCSRVP